MGTKKEGTDNIKRNKNGKIKRKNILSQHVS